MWQASTLVIEITGIMGAGYLPTTLKALQVQLCRDYLQVLSDGTRRPPQVMYHVDNTAMKKWNPHTRQRIKTWIVQKDDSIELKQFTEAVKLADQLFWENVDEWKKPVDLVFRRGGMLQSFKRLNREKWRTALLESVQPPKIQVFLTADENTIAETYKSNLEVRRVLEREPDVYNETAERAYEEQQAWLAMVERLPGLVTVTRTSADKRVFVADLIRKLRAPLTGFGYHLVEKMSLFISHSSKDEAVAKRLCNDLNAKGIQCWLAPRDMPIGAKILDSIDDAIRRRERVLLLLSKNSIESAWVEDEVSKAFAEERRRNRVVLFPIRLDDGVMQTSKPWAIKIRDQRNIGDL